METLTEDDPVTVGGYQLLARCGSGRLGAIYLGRSRSGDLAAVRVFRAWLASDDGFMATLAGCIAGARAIRSGAVAAIIDADLDAPRPWLAFEFVTGPSLSHAVRTVGPLGEVAAGVLALRLAEVLADLHGQGVVHGGLTPSDVLLAADGPRLVDVGMSVAADSITATQVGMTVGDPGHLSPEQVLGEVPEAVSDVFSLASVVVYAARGVGPFDVAGASPLAVARRILGGAPDLSGTAPELAECLAPCFEKLPEHRCSAADLVDHLAGYPVLVDAAWPSRYHDLWMREFAI